MNLDDIINYKRPKETYYEILGCDQSSSIEQINREYKIKALQLHPDKNPDPDSLEKFRKIQTAKDILTSESSRRSYDCWLSSGICIPFEQWQNKKGHSMHWASPRPSKLSIQTGSSTTGQGSEFPSINNNIVDDKNQRSSNNSDWLGKFRNYKI